jgi:hypothetical protein
MARSYYKTIAGVRYDRSLLETADDRVDGREDGRIAEQDIQELLALAQDGRGITETEMRTLYYIHKNYRFTPKASISLFDHLEGFKGEVLDDQEAGEQTDSYSQQSIDEPHSKSAAAPTVISGASKKTAGPHVGWISLIILLLLGLPVLVLTLSEGEQSIQGDVFQKWNKSVTQGNYEGFDMSEANLRGRDFTGANFRDANLKGANFQGAKLVAADFRGANLEKALLLGADLRSADLRGCNLKEANAAFANMTGANLAGADATGAKFPKAKLSVSNFDKAQLEKADFRGADLRQASIRDANLKYANMEGANTRGADMTGSDTYFMKGAK